MIRESALEFSNDSAFNYMYTQYGCGSQNMGWAYLRTVNAAAAAEGLIDTDPISTLSALHVEADALLGYSQVRLPPCARLDTPTCGC